jgi:hypothetical protein
MLGLIHSTSLAAARSMRASVAIASLLVILPASAAWSQPQPAAKDTPFGIELVPQNFPNSTIEDTLAALAATASIGSHSSFIWHWGDRPALPAILDLVPLMKQHGLKSLVQMGTVFLGQPAPPQGFPLSFGDPHVRALFLSDVATVASTRPDYFVLTTEVNLLHRFNPAEFENFRTLYQEAYALVKSISPGTSVGVSYLESLWFANYFIDGVDVPALLAPSDFIAFTAYPEWLVSEGHYASIADIPAEWHGSTRYAYPDARILYTEVGWSSKGRGTPELQAEFVRHLPRLLSKVNAEIITWSLLADVEFFTRDLLTQEATEFLESIGVDIDTLFEHFNGMGLMRGDGQLKPAYADAAALNFKTP